MLPHELLLCMMRLRGGPPCSARSVDREPIVTAWAAPLTLIADIGHRYTSQHDREVPSLEGSCFMRMTVKVTTHLG